MTFSSCLQTIDQCCDRLRQLSQQDIIDRWGIRFDAATTPPPASSIDTAPRVELDDRRYALWPRGRVAAWFTTRIIIPDALRGYAIAGKTLRLALRWWAEDAQIFVNGERVLAGDLYDCFGRVVLMPIATPGTAIDLAIRLVSPGHDAGALVTSVLQYESEYTPGCFDPAFVADELAVVVARLCPTPQETPKIATSENSVSPADPSPETCDRLQHLATLLEPLQSRLQTQDPEEKRDIPAFSAAIDQQLAALRDRLARDFPRDALAIHLLTHAHLDMAWLWPLSETYDAAQRTFESVLTLQNDYPDTIYTHSSPALYAWIEEHRPDLFAQIQTQVKRDRWDVAAGMWVEPELNIIAGESIVRQILYGQRYCEAKFGQISRVAWLPDSFGFCWQLPQLFAQGGIDYFVTQKLRWNDTTEFPYELFYWRSPDGTEIPAWMSSPIGTDIDPVQMTRYAAQWQAKTDRHTALWLPGAGDHGGGPTRDMLDRSRRWQTSPVFPALQFQSSADFLDTVTQPAQDVAALPVWASELYLELHRGCYTTYASQKRANRTCEILLYQAELYATIAAIHTGHAYPKADLDASWKRVLLNQFHDILPGSAIPEVFAEADREWAIAEATARSIRDTALQAIAAQFSADDAVLEWLHGQGFEAVRPLIVFNPILGQRSDRIVLDLAEADPWVTAGNAAQRYQIFDDRGTPIDSQQDGTVLQFDAIDLPSLGAQRYWIAAIDRPAETPPIASPVQSWTIQNEFLLVEIDPKTGDIARCFDRIQQREVLAPSGGNRLEAYTDQGQYWDAWNIDPEYENHPIEPPVLESIQWLEGGEPSQDRSADTHLRSRLRVIRRLKESRFIQDYILDRGSPLLEIATIVDWRERHIVVKTAFDLAFQADHAVYETPCGAIERPIRPQTPADRAQWEVPMLQWCDLSQGDSHDHDPDLVYGVSLLNDCKYGGDATPDRLRLTLLRGSTWPDPEADLGEHRFRYALYPHAGTWQTAATVRRAIAFNQPPIVLFPTYPSHNRTQTLPLNCDWLQLGSDQLVLMALKQTEDGDRWLLRCYESAGETAPFEITGALGCHASGTLDLLERSQAATLDRVTPWRIVTVALTPSPIAQPTSETTAEP